MLLAIDVGNTNITIGVFQGEKLTHQWRISTQKWETADEFAVSFTNLLAMSGLKPAQIRKTIIASVVPPLQEALAEMSRIHFNLEPIIVNCQLVKMPIRYHNPQEVGADRLVNAVAGYKKYGGPLIIVDFGTATTFCVISAQGEYLGGCIAPGVNISAEALYQFTAKLPRIEVIKPPQVIGKTTVGSMQAGLFYGYCALVDGIVERIEKELGKKAKVIATGGLAGLISSETKSIQEINSCLTLDGLRMLADE